mgnify:CR=1 FL=1
MKRRAVIYCRCSTDEESQKEALVKQEAEAREAVEQKGWILAGTYVESGSGTSRKGRKEYNRLYEELLYDKFDIIVIKSQDRLMRNTRDWYLFIDRMTLAGKQLYMYLEQKFYSPNDGLITGIKAILAEDYSRELSKKINNAHRNRQKSGGAVILTSRAYGFVRKADRTIGLQEEEAAVKRRMYELCAAGCGCRTIAAILKEEGVCGRGGRFFSSSDILRMIKNPLNKGTAVMNKSHYDFETKRTRPVPAEKQFIYENKVPATVSEELWSTANEKIAQRSQKPVEEQEKRRGKNTGRHPLSGRIYCGLCGSPYYRRGRKKQGGKEKVYEWKCSDYLENGRPSSKAPGGCSNVHVDENRLFELLGQNCGKDCGIKQEKILEKAVLLIRKALQEVQAETECVQNELKRIENQREVLLDKLLNEILTDDVYQKKDRELREEGERIKAGAALLGKKKEKKDKERTENIEAYLKEAKVIEKAAASVEAERLKRVEIFPDRMILKFQEMQKEVIYGTEFDYYSRKHQERGRMAELIRQKPDITASELAEYFGITVSGVNYRLRKLRQDGAIKD